MNDSTAYRTYLKSLVKRRSYVKVQYFTELHALITLNALVVSLSIEGNDQIVVLSTGDRIPLPNLVSAGEEFAPDYKGYAPYCETCDC